MTPMAAIAAPTPAAAPTAASAQWKPSEVRTTTGAVLGAAGCCFGAADPGAATARAAPMHVVANESLSRAVGRESLTCQSVTGHGFTAASSGFTTVNACPRTVLGPVLPSAQ
jgi:hypothetical protein